MKNYQILYIVLFITVSTFAQKSVLIRYQPKVGSTLKNEMSAIMDITLKAGTQTIQTKIKMGFEMLYIHKERKNEINKLELIFKKITMDMKSPMMNGSYTSENKEETDPFALKIAEGFKGVLGTPVPMSINTKAEFTETIDIVTIFPQIPASKAKELKEQLSNQMIQFPEHKVKVGDRWNMLTTMNQVGELELTYTLTGIEKKRLLLSVTGKMMDSENATIKMLGAVISGDVVLDRQTGETLESNIVMDMDMKMVAQGSSMDMNIKAEISMKAVRI